MAFRFIREIIPSPHEAEGRRALIYGAGDGGEMLLRELRKNSDWNFRPVGFVDDDPLKKDKLINGLKVFDSNGSLARVCRDLEINVILISTGKIEAAALKEVKEFAAKPTSSYFEHRSR